MSIKTNDPLQSDVTTSAFFMVVQPTHIQGDALGNLSAQNWEDAFSEIGKVIAKEMEKKKMQYCSLVEANIRKRDDMWGNHYVFEFLFKSQ